MCVSSEMGQRLPAGSHPYLLPLLSRPLLPSGPLVSLLSCQVLLLDGSGLVARGMGRGRMGDRGLMDKSGPVPTKSWEQGEIGSFLGWRWGFGRCEEGTEEGVVLSAAALGSEALLLLAWSPTDSSLGPALPLSAILQEQTGSLSWYCVWTGKQGLGGPAWVLSL